MKQILYIILISGLIPATWLLVLTFLGIYFTIPNVELSFDYLITIVSMILGICGYVGLLMLLKGLHKKRLIIKLSLLVCGLIGFLLFMLHVSPRNFNEWLMEYDLESMIGKWPLIVSVTFCLLLISELIKKTPADNV